MKLFLSKTAVTESVMIGDSHALSASFSSLFVPLCKFFFYTTLQNWDGVHEMSGALGKSIGLSYQSTQKKLFLTTSNDLHIQLTNNLHQHFHIY